MTNLSAAGVEDARLWREWSEYISQPRASLEIAELLLGMYGRSTRSPPDFHIAQAAGFVPAFSFRT